MGFDAFTAAFKELTESERDHLRRNCNQFTFEPGTDILNEGEFPEYIYVVTKGRVRVTHSMALGSGGEFVTPLGPGETIGEMSFVDGLGASATLIADGEVVVEGIGHQVVEKLSAEDSGFASRFYRSLLLVQVKRLRATNTRIPLPFA